MKTQINSEIFQNFVPQFRDLRREERHRGGVFFGGVCALLKQEIWRSYDFGTMILRLL